MWMWLLVFSGRSIVDDVWLILQGSTAAGERGCEGANDEDECMMRRTLAAHTDYIYTQEHHN